MKPLIHSEIAIADYAVPLQEAWGDLVDIRQEQQDEYDQLGWGSIGSRTSTGRTDDRRGGSLRPVYENEQELDNLRAISRIMAECTPTGKTITENLTNYVIGSGFVYKASPRKGSQADKQLVAIVQMVLDRFIEANSWDMDRERELFLRGIRDGEWFLGLYPTDGYLCVRPIDPERIREPTALRVTENPPTFGIETEPEDIETAVGYWVLWDELVNEPERMDASEVLHCKRNVDANIKRGVSDFFTVNSDVNAVKKLLRSMVKGGSVQAAIAYIVQHAAGITGAQVQANIQQTHGTMRYDQPSQLGPRTRYMIEEKSGTRLDVPKGQEYKGSPLANGEAANAFVEIQQAGLRSIGAQWCMPEYMVSGDASNANYASTKEAGAPFVRKCEVEQQRSIKRYRQVMWLAVKVACEAGLLPADYRTVRRLVDIQIEPPAVEIRNAKEETDRRAVLHDKGALSLPTWQAQEGLDPDEERNNGAKLQQPAILPGAIGAPPPSQPVQESAQDRLSAAARLIWKDYP